MNASASFANSLLKLILQNESIPGIGDAAGILGSSEVGAIYLRLCTDEGEVDAITIGAECTYAGYVAKGIAIARTDIAFPDSENVIFNAVELLFGACTAGSENVRYVELWKNNTGSTEADRIAWVQLTADLAVAPGVQPKFAAEALTFTFD